ncbi:uncharacterized protein LOC62_01G001566 [Vanrija pseudolonga]|uniref:Uncharacterized protein n=1 Tax=Vanrija pseudolonga TaxID=143232 RepID=A0AAF1BG16_9TREE|nr:hypothetical protein LOC62_01G001566 [Vanrija pseudolonga]
MATCTLTMSPSSPFVGSMSLDNLVNRTTQRASAPAPAPSSFSRARAHSPQTAVPEDWSEPSPSTSSTLHPPAPSPRRRRSSVRSNASHKSSNSTSHTSRRSSSAISPKTVPRSRPEDMEEYLPLNPDLRDPTVRALQETLAKSPGSAEARHTLTQIKYLIDAKRRSALAKEEQRHVQALEDVTVTEEHVFRCEVEAGRAAAQQMYEIKLAARLQVEELRFKARLARTHVSGLFRYKTERETHAHTPDTGEVPAADTDTDARHTDERFQVILGAFNEVQHRQHEERMATIRSLASRAYRDMTDNDLVLQQKEHEANVALARDIEVIEHERMVAEVNAMYDALADKWKKFEPRYPTESLAPPTHSRRGSGMSWASGSGSARSVKSPRSAPRGSPPPPPPRRIASPQRHIASPTRSGYAASPPRSAYASPPRLGSPPRSPIAPVAPAISPPPRSAAHSPTGSSSDERKRKREAGWGASWPDA